MPRSKKSANEPATSVTIDGRKIVDQRTFHEVLAHAFGFPKTYGDNLDALIDCLTYLDDPKSNMSGVSVAPGTCLALIIEGAGPFRATQRTFYDALVDSVMFVNTRRMEKGQSPVLALAFAKG
jgi:hypothetical protein